MPAEMDEVEQVIEVDTSGNRAALRDAIHEQERVAVEQDLLDRGVVER